MYKVKVIGAGSIGNHLSQAARVLGWEVALCDTDPAALERTKNDIYPSRYGSWDEGIKLYECKDAPVGGFDIIFIGTPPESHMKLALASLEEKPKLVFVEKPFCPPSLEDVRKVEEKSKETGIPVIVGFDHGVSKAIGKMKELLDAGEIGTILTHDVEFRESWAGIFKAHPWLAGPHDSYLGFWKQGGGASSEHSHALHLWLTFAEYMGFGKAKEVTANIEYKNVDGCEYDSIFALNIVTEKGEMGRVIQDVITAPTRKCTRIQGDKGVLEWFVNYTKEGDGIVISRISGEKEEIILPKKRPDDFLEELKHIKDLIEKPEAMEKSPLRFFMGAHTAQVVGAAHKSAQEKKTVSVDEVKW